MMIATPRATEVLHWVSAWCCSMLLLSGCDGFDDSKAVEEQDPVSVTAEYVGGGACAGCHGEEADRWKNSHHDLAMQVASEETVLGDFDAAKFTYNNITSEFFRRDGSFWIRTDGVDGELSDFRITHTFGVEPLQQYLVELAAGQVQALSTAWDTRPAEQGGQRWFHLYQDEALDSTDPLHWTGIFQSWNTTCASCHSTNLRKNYSASTGSFATTFSSINVDCEACHGPGSLHAAAPGEASMLLKADPDVRWVFDQDASIARRVPARNSQLEIETCAQCHSRRGQITDDLSPGAPLLDAFRPALLQSDLYHADGQISDEVYVYGSFLQSRMHAAGVSCSDCHDPHSNQLKFDGNAVCGQCHLAVVYDVRTHSHHEPDAPGSQCVNCHMPAKTYMVVDPRRDHSFRVPRPDLSAELAAPNACNGCHADKNSEWAAARVAEWFPDGRTGSPHYGQALAAGRNWASDRSSSLLQLAADNQAPAIVRATAISLLAEQVDDAALAAIVEALKSDSTLIQLTALNALSSVPVQVRVDPAREFLHHPVRALRITAARLLVSALPDLRQAERVEFDSAIEEYRQAQAFNSDRAEGLLNLAGLLLELGQYADAELALNSAIEREPYFAAAYINLADLYRQSGRDTEAQSLLKTAIENNADDPAGHLALGLTLVRSGDTTAALTELRRAAELAPGTPYYQYIAGVALNSLGEQQRALQELGDAHTRFPGYRDITFALATMNRDAGDYEAALRYARELLALSPADAAARGLITELEQAAQ
jgi:tetratricopeptide (TPR) repeat protein